MSKWNEFDDKNFIKNGLLKNSLSELNEFEYRTLFKYATQSELNNI